MNPYLSVIVPSIGRPGLFRLIDSLAVDWVEWIIVFDTSRSDRVNDVAVAQRMLFERNMLYWTHADGGGDYGQAQRNYGMTKARGYWLAFSQDDNVFTPEAENAIARQSDRVPHLYRIAKWPTHPGEYVWRQRGILEANSIDGDCLVVPNVPERLGSWGSGYAGDWQFVSQTVGRFGEVVEWHETVIQRGV